MHYYVYRYSNGNYLFERTCGTRQAAEEWVIEYRRRGDEAVYLIDHTINGGFY